MSLRHHGVRDLVRAARFVAQQFVRPAPVGAGDPGKVKILDDQLRRLRHHERLCSDKGWKIALLHVRRRILSILDLLATLAAERSDTEIAHPHEVTEWHVLEDLLALMREFESVRYQGKTRKLVVTTEPVELEGVYLGPFDICLSLKQLSRSSRAGYDVVAVDPSPARSASDVTHPHVRNDGLCEGEAHVAIGRALVQGRLVDFFQLVAGVLRNYNDQSPYVPLSDWRHIRCQDCDDLFDPDEGYNCERCDAATCCRCYCTCSECDEVRCSDCSRDCDLCGQGTCEACVHHCEGCSRAICVSCLELEKCNECQKHAESEVESSPADPQVQPLCVGKTVVCP